MKTLKSLAIVSLISVFVGSQSNATPLNNLVPGLPDFGSTSLTVSYDAITGTFQATGFTDGYINPSGVNSADSGYSGPFVADYADLSFDLTAHITTAGVLTSGTVTILGSMDGTGETVETLLTGNLNTGADGTAFGSAAFGSLPAAGGDYFQFLFTVTGGDSTIVNDFGGLNAANREVIVSPDFSSSHDVLFNGSWAADFNNDYSANGNADTVVPVPEPASNLMLLLGAVLFVLAKCCGRNKAWSGLKN